MKKDTNMHDAIATNVKLAATILYLATGYSYSDLQYQFRVHATTISKFIPEVCDSIYRRLKMQYMKV